MKAASKTKFFLFTLAILLFSLVLLPNVGADWVATYYCLESGGSSGYMPFFYDITHVWGDVTAIAQTFNITGGNENLYNATFFLDRHLVPEGNITAYLKGHDGDYGNDSPNSTIYDASTTVLNIADLISGEDFQACTFDFGGSYEMRSGEIFSIVLQVINATNGGSIYSRVYYESWGVGNPHLGAASYFYADGGWVVKTSPNSDDLSFYINGVYTEVEPTPTPASTPTPTPYSGGGGGGGASPTPHPTPTSTKTPTSTSTNGPTNNDLGYVLSSYWLWILILLVILLLLAVAYALRKKSHGRRRRR